MKNSSLNTQLWYQLKKEKKRKHTVVYKRGSYKSVYNEGLGNKPTSKSRTEVSMKV